jgi:3-hydroxyacyl-CoA dehydrogenase
VREFDPLSARIGDRGGGMKYGFIGPGNLGRKLAGSLVREGFDVTLTDINPAAAESDILSRRERPAIVRESLAASTAILQSAAPHRGCQETAEHPMFRGP